MDSMFAVRFIHYSYDVRGVPSGGIKLTSPRPKSATAQLAKRFAVRSEARTALVAS